MRQAYRPRVGQESAADHWRGGPPRHEGAECPVCRKPLLLFWDINCRDPRFAGESAELFAGLERLPLYYCCRRPEPTTYRVVSPGRIETFRPSLEAGEESPFRDAPAEFDRRPLHLEPLPRDIENLLAVADRLSFDWLDAAEMERLAEYLGRDRGGIYGAQMSQFGGAPIFRQGNQGIDCPNPICPTHQMGNPHFPNDRKFKMKELAVIADDAGFEMETNCAQIAFHICWKCNTIHAGYRID